MTKRLLLAPLLPALMLGGCGGAPNRGLESVHQPVVARADYALDLSTAGDALASGEDARLAGWLSAMRLGYGDRIAIDDRDVGTMDAARDQVAEAAARHGMLLSDDAPVTPAPLAAGTLRVVVSRSSARVPGCPDFTRGVSHEFGGATSSNQGCAVNSNLAAMVADPQDLVRGRSGADTVDAAVSAKAIDAFRKAAPTGGGGKVQTQATGAKSQ